VFGWLLKIYYDENGLVVQKLTQAVNEQLMFDDTVDPSGPRKKTDAAKAKGKKSSKKAAKKAKA